jgi:Xaa-Pro aminopeptidase
MYNRGMQPLLPEIRSKQQRLLAALNPLGFDGALLATRAWFAWITGGRVNRIANSSPDGVAGILVTGDGVICLTNTIESPRFRLEELLGTGIEVVDFPWHSASKVKETCLDVIAGRKIAGDSGLFGLGLPPLPKAVEPLRWALCPEEIVRYREGGRLAADAVEAACREVTPGMSEHEIAGRLTHHVHRRGLNPVVTLIATDDRVRNFRHPIPVDRKVQQYAMLVNCSELGGLISNLTRIVHFGKVSTELAKRHQAVCEVDAQVNQATQPGKTFGSLFSVLQRAYSDAGHAGEWEHHHQGGSTGYAGREVFATPGDTTVVLDRQAFAWNPSIAGTKSEDTVLVDGGRIEVLTAAGAAWPRVETRSGMVRPGILEV